MRYGYLHPYLAVFLASVDSSTYLLFFTSPSALSFLHRYFTLCPLLALAELFHPLGSTIFLCHCIIYSNFGSTGICTGCPSSTPFGLDLGPDLPRADEPSPGILGLTVTGISIRFFATHACMVTCMKSTIIFIFASLLIQRSSTTCIAAHPRLRF